MKATPGASSATADPLVLPGMAPLGWPAPYAQVQPASWVEQLLAGLPLAVALLDGQGLIVGGNEGLTATLGPDAGRGTDPTLLVEPEDRPALSTAIRSVMQGISNRAEVAVRLIGSIEDKQLVSITPSPPGIGVSVLLALRDIRERQRLEAQVQAATRMQAVGQLAGGIAHDFNNILTAILALSEQLIERNPADHPDHESASEIRRNGKRAAALVAQLLAFARRQPQRPQLLDLSELLSALRPLLQQLVGKGVQLEMSTPPGLPTVRADPGQIEQVIVNLAVNARDAMDGQGLLEISLAAVPASAVAALGHQIMPNIDHLVIEVRDGGAGIPSAIAGKIFEPFFTTKKLGEGTVLGLSTVYVFLKQSAGFIFAAPGQKGGTVFCIYLPALDRVKRAASRPAKAVAPKALSGRRLLLVEDETTVREVLRRGLEKRGLLVEAVADADSAISALASDHRFDILLSDVMMPGTDGVTLAAQARANQPGLAVLLMSGFAEPPLHKAAETAGIGFIAKPFALAELVEALDEALSAVA